MYFLIYSYLFLAVVALLLVIVAAMTLRLIFNYSDPNPFGKIGRFAHWLKKKTDSIVRPAAGFLAGWRIDARIAPFLTLLSACVLGYFALQIAFGILYMLNGVTESLANGNISSAIGYLLVGALAIYSFLVFMRIVSTWVLGYGSKIRLFLGKICNPVLVPFQRLIPPFGGFDFSPILVVILLGVLQTVVDRTLITAHVPFSAPATLW